MRWTWLIGALLSGLAFAFLTWLMIGDHPYLDVIGSVPRWLGPAIFVFLYPGLFVGLLFGGNVHLADAWLAALGNFLFYFAVVYFVGKHREKRTAALSSLSASHQDSA